MTPNDPYAALRIREFNRFLLLRFVLVFGWSMQFIIVEWEVYSITKDPLSVGMVGLMEIIPAVGMALIAGHIVDRTEKRNLLAICIALFSLMSLGLFLLTYPPLRAGNTDKFTLQGIYALVFFGGLLRAFFGPTIFSLVALLVPKQLYPNAATWNSSTKQMATVLGPAFAGFTIGWIGVHGSLCIVFVLVLMSLMVLFFIKEKPILNPKAGEPMMQSLKEGIRFVYNSKVILGAISLDMVAVFFGGAIALLPVYAQDILKVGSEGFGLLRAAPSVGAFLVMLIIAYVPITKQAGHKLLVAIFGFGLCIIAFGLSRIFWVSVFILFLYGVTDGISMVIRQTILQLKTPDAMRGRVGAVNSMFVSSSNELGAFESGVTAKIMGVVPAVLFGGTITLLTVVLVGLKNKTLRNLDLQDAMTLQQKD